MANENLKNGPVNPDAENDEEMTVTLTLDDGTELECVVLTIFEAGEKEYIALLPLDGREAEDGEVYLYRYVEDINGNPDLENIDSDEEYEIVADAFDELLDSAEYDELVSEDVVESEPQIILKRGCSVERAFFRLRQHPILCPGDLKNRSGGRAFRRRSCSAGYWKQKTGYLNFR